MLFYDAVMKMRANGRPSVKAEAPKELKAKKPKAKKPTETEAADNDKATGGKS